MNEYDYLPPIHRPMGSRPTHDDYFPGLKWIPRWWDAKPLAGNPWIIYGNQNYWVKDSYPYKEYRGPWKAGFVPKPIPPAGQWALTKIPTIIFGMTWILPSVAITTKNGWHFRIGLARFSDDYSDQEKRLYWYSQLFSIAIRKNPI